MAFIDPIIENNRSDPGDGLDDEGLSVVFHEKQEDVTDVSLDPLTVLERPYLDEAVGRCDTVVAFLRIWVKLLSRFLKQFKLE